ncbi:MAG: recombination regulator RecX [Coriobacteriales bacterium]|jgi:regulatory protein|nr:recombination regulator RecX [Coriobacteriales bacterium]
MALEHDSLTCAVDTQAQGTTSDVEIAGDAGRAETTDNVVGNIGTMDDAGRALNKIVRLLKVRDRSVNEMSQRLKRDGYTQAAIERALDQALCSGLLDDQRFARNYINGKLRSGWGAARIEYGLSRFGVDVMCLEDYPDAYFDDQSQLERALAALAKLRPTARDKQAGRYRFLIQKGYSTHIVRRAVRMGRNIDVDAYIED